MQYFHGIPPHYRNRCLILIRLPGFTSTTSTWGSKSPFRISILCRPGWSSISRNGGATPYSLPLALTSPQGRIVTPTIPGPAGAGASGFLAGTGFAGVGTALGAGAAGLSGSDALGASRT